MKAITLWEPYATLIAVGAKRYETRSWPTRHRGPIAIHAAARWTPEQQRLARSRRVLGALSSAGVEEEGLKATAGSIVAVATLVGCYRTEDIDPARIGADQLAFGDWRRGRWAWLLDGVLRLDNPVFVRGRQGIWEWVAGAQSSDWLREWS